MLLRYKQSVEIPEARLDKPKQVNISPPVDCYSWLAKLNPLVGGHLLETHLEEDLPELGAHFIQRV